MSDHARPQRADRPVGARSALTGRSEEWEVIEASSLKPKVAGPSMLGIGSPDRHVLPLTPAENAWTATHASSPPAP
jgi:hypothetical protein